MKTDEKTKPWIRTETIPSDYTVVDIETTGLSSGTSEILEIGAVCVRDGEIADTFSELIRPYRGIPPFITELTGISEELVKDADTIEDVLPRFLYFASGDIIVGHNVCFDLKFLSDRAEFFGLPFSGQYVDTLILARRHLKNLPHHRLSDLADYYNIRNDDAHRALADCLTTHEVLKRLAAVSESNKKEK